MTEGPLSGPGHVTRCDRTVTVLAVSGPRLLVTLSCKMGFSWGEREGTLGGALCSAGREPDLPVSLLNQGELWHLPPAAVSGDRVEDSMSLSLTAF